MTPIGVPGKTVMGERCVAPVAKVVERPKPKLHGQDVRNEEDIRLRSDGERHRYAEKVETNRP